MLFGAAVVGTEGGAAKAAAEQAQGAQTAPAPVEQQAGAAAAQRRGETPASRTRARASSTAGGDDAVARRAAAAWGGPVRPGGGVGISCVPYARMVSGIQVTGNGGQWWANAAGLYDRGQRPERGSVMAFRSTGGMARGHVAVVSRVHGPRHVEIDHANWAGPGIRRGSVMRDVSVIDVSDRNDWSAVRVQVGWDPYTYGRVYPTYGFIYNRPKTRTMMAGTGVPRRGETVFEEVAADLRAEGAGGRGGAAGGR